MLIHVKRKSLKEIKLNEDSFLIFYLDEFAGAGDLVSAILCNHGTIAEHYNLTQSRVLHN